MPAAERLHPLLPERVWVMVTDEGEPVLAPPVVEAQGGRVRFGGGATLPGVWPLLVTSLTASDVQLTVRAGAEEETVTLPVEWPARTPLEVPARTDAVAQGGPLEVLVTGDDLPPVELLQVTLGEGRVLRRTRTEAGILLTIELHDRPTARVVSIGVLDPRASARPAWGEIRVRARPRIPLEADPGARVTLRVGERAYGPFVVGDDGRVEVRIDQYPGETSVLVELEDDIGNATTSTLPLNDAAAPSLLAMAGTRVSPSRPPRVVWLRAVHPAGRAWRGEAPSCRSPAVGTLEVVSVAPGLFAVAVDGSTRDVRADIRLECRLQEAATTLPIGPRPDIATSVLLQVWPTELSTDLPVAEVRVALEDAAGQRLDPANVHLHALHGTLRAPQVRQDVLAAEYDGTEAVEPGVDTITATYRNPVVEGRASSMSLAFQPLPSLGRLRVRARPLDLLARPLRDVEVEVEVGETRASATTDRDGLALVDLPLAPDRGALIVSARSGEAFVRAVSPAASLSPFEVDSRFDPTPLEASRTLTLSPGRVAGLSVAFDPPVLRTGRNSIAYVTVGVEDRSGRPITDQPVRVTVSEGSVGPLIPRPDGTLVAEYQPTGSDRARIVTVTASTDTMKSSGRIALEPRLGRVMVGPSVGWTTNLGRVSAPRVGVVADVRTRLLAETVVVRAAFGGYGVTGTAATGIGEDARLDGSVLPATLGVLLRQDRGGLSFWGGGGGTLAFHPVTARFGDVIVADGTSVLGGGTIVGGIGYRLGVGDLVAELEWAFLPGTGGELAFTGNLGGLTPSAGFRLVY